MGDLEQEGESSKIQRKDQEIGFSKALQMKLCLWKESKWEDADKEVVGLCNRDKRRICAKEGEDVSIIKRGKRRNVWVHQRTIEERVY